MKNILVSYTLQEKDEATGNYISVNHKGYIQHWDCCPKLHRSHNPQYRRKIPTQSQWIKSR